MNGNLKQLEPVIILASHIETGSLGVKDLTAWEYSLANLYNVEYEAQKAEEQAAQEELARMMGVPLPPR